MDWLDEKIDKLLTKMKHLSLRKALSVYIVLCVIFIVISYAVTLAFCERWDNFIWSKYSDTKNSDISSYIVYAEDDSKLSDMDLVLVNVIDFIQTWSVFIYSIGGIIGVSCFFYNRRLKVPLSILKEATDQVGKNNLDIEIYYDNNDEMGDLCSSFDKMKKELITNNQKMWDMMEEQKRLNAAFAHDLRTPLTILQGYTDFLKKYIPEGKVSEDKLICTLSMMSNQVCRLERFSNTMKEIYTLDEMPIHKMNIQMISLQRKLKEITEIMNGADKVIIYLDQGNNVNQDMRLNLDEAILMEVFDNLISNAIRFANHRVEVSLSCSKDRRQLLLTVMDDGKGFTSKELVMATKPYYSGENKAEHFGIGLYLCKLLCEKHGGWISLSNRMEQGACVTATFSVDFL